MNYWHTQIRPRWHFMLVDNLTDRDMKYEYSDPFDRQCGAKLY